MQKYNINGGSSNKTRPLLNELRIVLEAHEEAFQQEWPFIRAQALVLGSLFAFGRKTMTQLLQSEIFAVRISTRMALYLVADFGMLLPHRG